MKDVLNFVTTMHGALSVMTAGEHLMQMLCVDSLDFLIKVLTAVNMIIFVEKSCLQVPQQDLQPTLDLVVVQFCLTMLAVQELRTD